MADMRGVMNDEAKRLRERLKIPKGQKLWELRCDVSGMLTHIVTSDELKRKWNLYSVSDSGTLTKVDSGDTPLFGRR